MEQNLTICDEQMDLEAITLRERRNISLLFQQSLHFIQSSNVVIKPYFQLPICIQLRANGHSHRISWEVRVGEFWKPCNMNTHTRLFFPPFFLPRWPHDAAGWTTILRRKKIIKTRLRAADQRDLWNVPWWLCGTAVYAGPEVPPSYVRKITSLVFEKNFQDFVVYSWMQILNVQAFAMQMRQKIRMPLNFIPVCLYSLGAKLGTQKVLIIFVNALQSKQRIPCQQNLHRKPNHNQKLGKNGIRFRWMSTVKEMRK